MPVRIDEVLSELRELKKLICDRINKIENVPRYLNIDAAIEYLKSQGISMSKSTLYKRSARDKIPKHKIDNKLYFTIQELTLSIIEQYGK